ncbi:hypothetical protein PVK63_13690 [Aliivibrio sp. S2TY2]|uniref:hypothetical protein n=1 Tax=unclassified Aliivibrio TaxID=2645654 RepID=UPI0023781C05|nr:MULTISPECIES: hypothetical protein [unclassified Aliivibrio]MDD9176092.1 hypothetical protein [Aliivibrio sp. S3TY1]MDD9192994.1 hypothetical protein [Aliivibrio sp. S2TY2]
MSQDKNQKLWPLTYTLDSQQKIEHNGEHLTLAQLYLKVITELSNTKEHNKYTLGIDDEMIHELWRLPALPRLTSDNKITYLMANCIDYSFPVLLEILKNIILLESESEQRKAIVEAIDANLSWPLKKKSKIKKDDAEQSTIGDILFKVFNQGLEQLERKNLKEWPSFSKYNLIDSLRKKKLFYIDENKGNLELTINVGADRQQLTRMMLQENPTVEIKEKKSKHIALGSLKDKILFIDVAWTLIELIESNEALCMHYYEMPLAELVQVNKNDNNDEHSMLIEKRNQMRVKLQAAFNYDMLES